MIRLSMLQFRIQAITAAATLVAFTILLAATGPHLASTYAADGLDSCHGSSCPSLATYFTGSLVRSPYAVLCAAQHRDHPADARRDRVVLGRAADRPRAGDRDRRPGLEPVRHPDPVAGSQAQRRRPGRYGRHRGAVPHAGLVGGADRPGRRRRWLRQRPRPEPVQPAELRHPRHHPDRLRCVRLRPRRHRRGADPAHRPGHGRHPGHLRRPPGRHAAVGPPQPRPARPRGHPGQLAGEPPDRHRPARAAAPSRSTPSTSPASPAPGSCPAGRSTPPGSQSAPRRPPARR